LTDEQARHRRLADNERLIREANWETSIVAADTGAASDEELDLWCACGRRDCTARILITLGEYRAAHEHPHRFIVAPGHADEAVETTIGHATGYDLVEKRPQYQAADTTNRTTDDP